MIDLIHKRHFGPAWIVIQEVGNGTGYNTKRHADAVAIGLWPSRGYEIHGYECKASRGDVQKELSDPAKADAVGKFCDYWWLVVEDLKIIDGLVIPETWGILHPKNKVLRVHRKAPQRKAVAVNRSFVAAMIRRVCDGWVPKHEHEELKRTSLEKAKIELAEGQKWAKDSAQRDLTQLIAAVDRFEKMSGISITSRYNYGDDGETVMPKNTWELDRIADAVKVVLEAREAAGHRDADHDNPVALVKNELAQVERSIELHERTIANRKASVVNLRRLLDRLESENAPEQMEMPLTGALATSWNGVD